MKLKEDFPEESTSWISMEELSQHYYDVKGRKQFEINTGVYGKQVIPQISLFYFLNRDVFKPVYYYKHTY